MNIDDCLERAYKCEALAELEMKMLCEKVDYKYCLELTDRR